MTQTDYTTRVLHADQGHFLTQRAEVAIADRAVTDRSEERRVGKECRL